MEKINTDPLQSTHVKNSGKTFQYAQNRDVTHLRIESFLRRLAKQINETEWFVSGSPLLHSFKFNKGRSAGETKLGKG